MDRATLWPMQLVTLEDTCHLIFLTAGISVMKMSASRSLIVESATQICTRSRMNGVLLTIPWCLGKNLVLGGPSASAYLPPHPYRHLFLCFSTHTEMHVSRNTHILLLLAMLCGLVELCGNAIEASNGLKALSIMVRTKLKRQILKQ